MCIIIAKERGKKYNKKELESAIEIAKIHNSDGAGFAFKRGNSDSIYLSKGYLFYYGLMLNELDKLDIQPEDELIVHLRYATAGDVDAANCHPFVVSDNEDMIKQDEIEVNLPVMAHNGTFYEYSYTNDVNSDTVNFIKDFASGEGVLDGLASMWKSDPFMGRKLLDSNRICVIFPGDKPMFKMGDWNRKTTEDNCFIYSNYYHIYPDSNRAYGNNSPHNVSKKYSQYGY